ncbi:MAG: glutamate-5-semialdehyde dehydrogenase [Candidatus Nanopelagicales bacterium]|jgi:glutamate-5-semialdehyde dehydrogenase|nr:glutamate-5-semialdehyde dehydrogenase [Candidatus Nanopelagicales bacterium]
MTETMNPVIEIAQKARIASYELAQLNRDIKDKALQNMADALITNSETITKANKIDVETATKNGTDPAIIDRLTLNLERIKEVAQGLRDIAKLPDPIGEVIRGWVQPNGLEIEQKRVPMGVIGMIYEARPNVTVDAAGLCLKSGNAVLLRGSSSAKNTNESLIQVMRTALQSSGIPADAIQIVPGDTHDSVKQLMSARGFVDLLIPRGGASLINSIVNDSLVPVIETGVGNCHVYIDEHADIDMAVSILVNSKASRVSVCNAAETFLVHKNIADIFLPKALSALKDQNVTIHGDEKIKLHCEKAKINFVSVTDIDWAAEYYSLDIAAGIVDSMDEAIKHIRKWSTNHTEAIVSDSMKNIDKFVSQIDSAAVMVNASTRFTDGGEFGFGAEIGISNQKLHARGPMGLVEMTSTKYVVRGQGHIRGKIGERTK